MSAERHISVTLHYTEPVNGVLVRTFTAGFATAEKAEERAAVWMADDERIYETVVTIARIDYERERRMLHADRALGLIPADGAS